VSYLSSDNFCFQGDITFRYLSYLKNKYGILDVLSEENKVTVCDINDSMLNVGKDRADNLGYNRHINWKVGNAENLEHEKDNTYDVYTIVFGIRNCTNIDKVVKEAYRVLKPGGRFLCMEFSRTKNPVFKKYFFIKFSCFTLD
jgi:2-methoxy-6-polyprenyl-1,4-benzoquinol methylase